MPLTSAIVQDRSGYLWFGTQSGLIRWDGHASRVYVSGSARPRALPDTFVSAIHIDRRGTLWVGTSSGGMARYDPASDDFTVIAPSAHGLSDAHIGAIADDGSGGLWIGTANGLDHMDAAGKFSARADSLLPPAPRGAAGLAVEALLLDAAGNLWIGTRGGLLRRSAGAANALPFGLDAPTSVLVQDTKGRIWIGTRNKGAFLLAPGAESAAPVQESGPTDTLNQQRVFAIAEVSPDEIWIGTEGGGIVALNPELGVTRRIRHIPDTADSLSDNDAYVLFRERSGLIVVGSTDTMSVHDPRQRAVVTVRDTGQPVAGRFTAPSVLVRPDGTIWVGVGGGGIDMLDPTTGGIGQVAAGKPGGLPTGRVLTMANGPDGKVYAGTQLGLYRIDADGKQVQQIALAQRSATAATWALAFQKDVLWVGGLDGLWVFQLGASGAPPTLLRHEDAGLGNSMVTSLLALDTGAIWLGTRNGLVYLASAQAQPEVLPVLAGKGDRLLPGFTSSLALDQQGRLWVSTFGRGVQVLERTDADGRRRFRRIETAQGLPDNSVNVIISDRLGAMWASTDKGLARIDANSFVVTPLSAADGVHITQYWTNSATLTTQGELLFGGITGLTVVLPDRLVRTVYHPPLVVTELALGDQAVPPERFVGQPGGGPPATLDISPAGKERGFSLEFAALDFSDANRMQYAYRLVGFDPDWIRMAPGARRLGYTNLAPGSYTLQLRAATADGVWMDPISMPVRTLPSWQQAGWVRILAALTGLAILFFLVQLRTAWYRRRASALESMVEQRTADLRASQAMLEQMAYADPLTGLPNRRLFNDELRHMRAQAAREKTPFTLLLIDLDRFKHINDTLGHDAGDAVLVEVSRRLRLCVRETDRLARLGGDEFAVLLSNTNGENEVNLVARRIVESAAEPIHFGAHRLQIGASIGAAAFGGPPLGEEVLYKQADTALYQAKKAGRNTWVWYRPEQDEGCV